MITQRPLRSREARTWEDILRRLGLAGPGVTFGVGGFDFQPHRVPAGREFEILHGALGTQGRSEEEEPGGRQAGEEGRREFHGSEGMEVHGCAGSCRVTRRRRNLAGVR